MVAGSGALVGACVTLTDEESHRSVRQPRDRRRAYRPSEYHLPWSILPHSAHDTSVLTGVSAEGRQAQGSTYGDSSGGETEDRPPLSCYTMPRGFLLEETLITWIMNLDSPASKAELEAALDRLLQEAYRNGVNVDNGGYDLIHTDETIPDWDLTIVRMEQREGA